MLDLGLVFLAGLLSSVHCVAMCGPLVTACSSQKPLDIAIPNQNIFVRTYRYLRPQLIYHGGRLISYSMVGLIAGLAGGILAVGFNSWVSYGLGAFMIFLGLVQARIIRNNWDSALLSRWTSSVRGLVQNDHPAARLLLGFITPLLPCGLLYGMTIEAAASGSPVTGAMHMAAFAAGSAPSLLALGSLVALLPKLFKARIPQIAGIVMILMGGFIVARGAGFGIMDFMGDHGMHQSGTQQTSAASCCKPAQSSLNH